MPTKWFVLASSNVHKSEELNKLFDRELLAIKAAEIKISVEENGLTFNDNALLKAEAYYQKYKCPIVADDSGIIVNAIPEELGVTSARFGGEGLDDAGRSELLLKKLSDKSDRSAYFVCVLCFYLSPEEIFFFEGRCHGNITTEFQGNKGFGYDPIFKPIGHNFTFAADPNWKEINGHRAKAVAHAQTFFSSFFK